MKKVLFLGVCVVLAGVLTAQAESLSFIYNSESVVVNTSRSVVNGTTDAITYTVASINNAGSSKLTGLAATAGGDAMFEVVGSGVIYTDWTNYKAIIGKGGVVSYPAAPKSYVAFDSDTLGYLNGVGYPDPVNGPDAVSIWDTWYTVSPTVQVGVGGTLAKIYVSTGTNITLAGTLAGTLPAIGLSDGNTLVFVPEPGTIALLASGLIGLLAYAWRKRK
jgi:hypothetical protein